MASNAQPHLEYSGGYISIDPDAPFLLREEEHHISSNDQQQLTENAAQVVQSSASIPLDPMPQRELNSSFCDLMEEFFCLPQLSHEQNASVLSGNGGQHISATHRHQFTDDAMQFSEALSSDLFGGVEQPGRAFYRQLTGGAPKIGETPAHGLHPMMPSEMGYGSLRRSREFAGRPSLPSHSEETWRQFLGSRNSHSQDQMHLDNGLEAGPVSALAVEQYQLQCVSNRQEHVHHKYSQAQQGSQQALLPMQLPMHDQIMPDEPYRTLGDRPEQNPSRETTRDLFYFLLQRAYEKGLKKTDSFSLRVGTMCSGTDAPIFALKELQDAAAAMGQLRLLDFDHVFSAEIEPFKQAFLYRNSRPSKAIFRDAVELGAPDAQRA
jgi:hypothetical protein